MPDIDTSMIPPQILAAQKRAKTAPAAPQATGPSMSLPPGITPFDLLAGPKGLAAAIARQRSEQAIDQRQATSEAAAERRLQQSEGAAEKRLLQSEQFQLNNRRPRYTYVYDNSGNLVKINEDTNERTTFPGLTRTPPRQPTMKIVGDTLLAVRFGPDGTPQVTTTKLPVSATKNLNEFQQYMGVYAQRHPEDPQMMKLSENYEADRAASRTGATLTARDRTLQQLSDEKFKVASNDPNFQQFMSAHPAAKGMDFKDVYKSYLAQTKLTGTERLDAETMVNILGQLNSARKALEAVGPEKWNRTFTQRNWQYFRWKTLGLHSDTGDPELDRAIDALITVNAQANAALAHASGTRAISFIQNSEGHIPRAFADFEQNMNNFDLLSAQDGPYRGLLNSMGLEKGGLPPTAGVPVTIPGSRPLTPSESKGVIY